MTPLVGQVGISLSNLLMGVLLIRYAAPPEYGLYVLGFSIAMFLVGIQDGLISVPVMVRAGAFGGGARERFLRWNRRALYLCVSLIAFVLIVAGLPTVAAIGWEVSPGFLVSVVAAAAAWIAWDFQRGEALALRRAGGLLRVDLTYLTVVAVGASALAAASRLSATAMLSTVACAAAGAAASGLVLARGRVLGRLLTARRALRLWWQRGRYSLLTGLVSWVQSQGYIYLCAGLLGLESLARVAAARLLFAPLATLLTAWSKATATGAAEQWREGRQPALLRTLLRSTAGFAALVALWCTVILAVQGFVLDDVFKGKYLDMTALVLAWGFAFLANAGRTVWQLGLRASGSFGQLARLAAMGAVVSLGVTFFGIHLLGEVGAIAGFAAAEALVGLLAALYCRSRSLRAS